MSTASRPTARPASRPRAPALAALLLLAPACSSGKAALPWEGAGLDARLLGDVSTWRCEEWEVDEDGVRTGEVTTWQGVFAQEVRLQFAPDALDGTAFDLPAPGDCALDVDMFPDDAGAGGDDIPDLSGRPTWATDVDEGELEQLADGFWYDDVFEDFMGCSPVEEVLAGGTRLTGAGVLTDVATPEPAEAPEVEFVGLGVDADSGADTIAWGDEITASWGDHDWDEVWVQIRREREGEVWESLTCNATGEDAFTVDADAWDRLDEDLVVERNNLYVGFQRCDETTNGEDVTVQACSRAIAVAVITD